MLGTISLNYWSRNMARLRLAELKPFSHAVMQRKNSFLLSNFKYNEDGMRRKSPTLAKIARVGHPTSTAKAQRQRRRETNLTRMMPAASTVDGFRAKAWRGFDLATGILLEYLLERFFEAGEGAKAV
jgi:hypothetical protein